MKGRERRRVRGGERKSLYTLERAFDSDSQSTGSVSKTNNGFESGKQLISTGKIPILVVQVGYSGN